MSAAAFGKALGPIAKQIGGEVVEGLSKAAPVAKKAFGKPGEISGTEFTERASRLKRIVLEQYPERTKYRYILPDLDENFDRNIARYYPSATDSFKKAVREYRTLLDRGAAQLGYATKKQSNFWKDNVRSPGVSTPGRRWDDVERAMNTFAQLEKAGVSREVTGKVFRLAKPMGYNRLPNSTIARVAKNIEGKSKDEQREHAKLIRIFTNSGTVRNPAVLESLSDELSLMTRDQLDVFNRLHSGYSPLSRTITTDAAGQITTKYGDYLANPFDDAAIIRSLNPEQLETFKSMLPEWHGTVEELANVARLL